MSLFVKCAKFERLAQKEPSFEPEDPDFYFGPEDDYDYSKMEGITTSDPGSNYGRLTEPLPKFNEDEAEIFSSQVADIEDELKPRLHDIERRLYEVKANSSFTHNAKQALIDTASSFVTCFEKISWAYVDGKSPEDAISAVKNDVRSIEPIRSALRRLIEQNRDKDLDEDVSTLARLSDKLYIVGVHIVKRVGEVLSSSRRKHVGKGVYDWK